MKLRLRLISSLVFSLHFFHIPGNAQNFEYALSQQEFQFGKIRDIVLFEDMVLYGGSVGNCEYPKLWLFDTSGNLRKDITLDISPNELGWIYSMRVDTTNRSITMLGYIQRGHDYGGSSIMAWKLDFDLNILDQKLFFDPQDFSNTSASLSEHFIGATHFDSFLIYDYNFNLVNHQTFQSRAQGLGSGLIIDSTLILKEHNYSTGQSYLFSVDWQGIIGKEMIGPEIKSMFTLRNSLFTIDQDHKLKKYTSNDLSIVDSIELTWTINSELRKISEHHFSLTLYENNKVTTKIYDENFMLLHEIQSDLNHETELITQLRGDDIYQAGKYYGYRPQNVGVFLYYRALVPFVRKATLNNQHQKRTHLEISNISLKNSIDIVSTDTSIYGEIADAYINMNEGGQLLIYDITVKNSTDTILNNFAYFADVSIAAHCFEFNEYRYIEGLELRPGEEITLRDTVIPYAVYRDRGLLFYVAAANHLLADSAFSSYPVFDLTTNTGENHFGEFFLYPNPVGNSIYLHLPDHLSNLKYQLFNSTGQLLKSANVLPSEIDIIDLKPGPYWIRLFDASKTITKKFIKIY